MVLGLLFAPLHPRGLLATGRPRGIRGQIIIFDDFRWPLTIRRLLGETPRCEASMDNKALFAIFCFGDSLTETINFSPEISLKETCFELGETLTFKNIFQNTYCSLNL